MQELLGPNVRSNVRVTLYRIIDMVDNNAVIKGYMEVGFPSATKLMKSIWESKRDE